ncbi:hypothetical protein LMG33818_001778 [Halomonadaceae bacterium LMG 33818]|uniref:SagB/ThcOx family dehydrogenase n=1 Tax=Cernens ardua TaxID=3402176 RepID=UPI003EDB8C20
MKRLKISEYFFLVPIGSNLVLWDTKNHSQYDLEKEYLDALFYFITDPDYSISDSIKDELVDAGIIVNCHDGNQIDTANDESWKILRNFFLEGTKATVNDYREVKPHDEEYIKYCQSISDSQDEFFYENFTLKNSIELPSFSEKEITNNNIVSLLKKRRTYRNFYTDRYVDIQKFSNIMELCFGYTSQNKEVFPNVCRFGFTRTSPAGGGLQSIEAYVYIRNVEGIEEGFYYYNPKHHCLHKIESDFDYNNFYKLFLGQSYMGECSFYVLYGINFKLLDWKYKTSRSARVALMDAGHLSQTFHLVSNSMDIQTCMTGAFFDDDLSDVFDLKNEILPVLVTGAGYSNGSTITKLDEEIFARDYQD